MAPLTASSNSPDPNQTDDSYNPFILQGQALLAENSPVRRDPEEDGGVVIYEVQPGDTVSGIAASHHISVNTILWANDLDNVDSIMPGDKIFILPVSGISYTVKPGDDIDSIASKFSSDKERIIAFNGLPANGDLKVGQEIIIPDAQGAVSTPAPKPSTIPSLPGITQRPYQSFGPPVISYGKPGAGHAYPYGYCTWYVAQRRYIPWAGNAGTWLYHARAAGYATGHTPRAGAIMVSSESWWGHVAYVESVGNGYFTVSEMNFEHFARKDYRTISDSSREVRGFIY